MNEIELHVEIVDAEIVDDDLFFDRLEILGRGTPGWVGDAWRVRDRVSGRFFVASGVDATYSGWEVLVFASDASGEVTGWGEVAGGQGFTHEEALQDLLGYLLRQDEHKEIES